MITKNAWRFPRTLNYNLPIATLFLLVIVIFAILSVLTLHLSRLNESQRNIVALPIYQLQFRHTIIENKRDGRPLLIPTHTIQNFSAKPIYKYHYLKLNSKNVMRGPYLPSKKRSPGWVVLTGNVVVHEGDKLINPHNISYLMNSEEACEIGFSNNSSLKILIFVESEVENFERRRVIRETWGLPLLQKTQNVKMIFMVGNTRSNATQEKIQQEYYTYGDMVQENFKEVFKHLTLKTVMGLKWAQTYCPQADFVVKTDDDILIHLPNLVQLLRKYEQNAKRVLLCHQNHSRRIERVGKVYPKYQVSPFELPGSFFPEYCSGFTYIMSRDTVSAFYLASMATPYFFIEDVYVTGFCRHKAGIRLIDDNRIALKPFINYDSAPCDFTDGRVTSQELTIEETQSIWRGINTKGFFCPVPVEDQVEIKKLKEKLNRVTKSH